MIETYDSNEAKFNKLYEYAKISFTGTISQIKTDTEVCVEKGSVSSGQNLIKFEEGWCLVIGNQNSLFDLAEYDVGTTLNVTTGIVGAPYDTDFLKEVTGEKRVLWLVGNDSINGHLPLNNIVTEISIV